MYAWMIIVRFVSLYIMYVRTRLYYTLAMPNPFACTLLQIYKFKQSKLRGANLGRLCVVEKF